jgi:hypothetical protein
VAKTTCQLVCLQHVAARPPDVCGAQRFGHKGNQSIDEGIPRLPTLLLLCDHLCLRLLTLHCTRLATGPTPLPSSEVRRGHSATAARAARPRYGGDWGELHRSLVHGCRACDVMHHTGVQHRCADYDPASKMEPAASVTYRWTPQFFSAGVLRTQQRLTTPQNV